MNFKVNGQYRTRSGRRVTVTRISQDLDEVYQVSGVVDDGTMRSWTRRGVHDVEYYEFEEGDNPLDLVGPWEEPSAADISERINDALLDFARKYGERITPWYIVLGRNEVIELAKWFEDRPRFGFQGNEYRTPNRFYSHLGEHRIVAVPFQSHFSLGFDPNVANAFDQTTPYWSIK